MRRLITLFIIVISALFFMDINASTLYKNVPDFSNNYLKRFNSYTRYFVTTDAPYGYEIDEIKNDSNYKLGGLLNKDEFLNSMDSNGTTYLFNGLEFWTMTKSDSSKMVVIDPKSTSKISSFPYDRSTGIRNTEYVQNGVYLSGQGTYTDPWTFVKKYYVTFVYDDSKVTITPRVAFAPFNGAVTVQVIDGDEYVYTSNDCGAELTIENKLKLENIKKDITCNITTALAYHTITYNPEGYCTPNTKKVKHGKEIGTMCVPTKTGYTFKDWYDEETGGTKVTKKTKLMDDMDLYARFEANEFIVKYNGNNNTGGETTNQTCTYDEECNLKVNEFMRTGYTFNGWNTKVDGTGTLYAERDSIKNIVSQGTKQFYAMWKANPITLAASTSTVSYNATSAQTKNNFMTEATGGTGSYKYEIVSRNDSSYFTLSGRNLTIKAATPSGTYPITIKATDNDSGSTAEGVMTLVINKIDATCPTLTAYSGTYDGSSHSITVSGGVGGTLNYSTDNSTWSTTKPTITDVGEITVYVKRASSTNYNEKACGSAKVTITQANATCPTLTAYEGNYDGENHTITVSGGANGTIQYRTATSGDGSTWSTTKPTRKNAGTTTVYVRMEATGNYKTTACGSKTIKIKKIDPTCPTLTAYSGDYNGRAHTIGVSGSNLAGGTTNYSTDGSTWSTTKPTLTDAGEITVYVKKASNTNYNEKQCGSAKITILPIDATCPDITSFNNYYDGKPHTIDVSGESNGTIQYSTNNSTWSTTKPTRTDVGTTTVYVRVVASGNYKTTSCGSRSIIISPPNAICPTLTEYNEDYDGKPHTIGVTGGSGGTIQYSTDNETWSTTKPTLTDVGVLTVYVRVVGDSNHNTVTCGYVYLAVEPLEATCPTIVSCCAIYDGKSHTITVTGGAHGTIYYRSSLDGGATWTDWSTTLPTRTEIGQTIVQVKILGDKNYHPSKGCTSANIDVRSKYLPCDD